MASHRTFADEGGTGHGSGDFPGFGTADEPVGPATGGVTGTAARSDHQHPILTTNTSSGMSALDVSTMPNGTPCFVIVRDAMFRLATSARAVNTWDTFASTDPLRQWLREERTSLKNAAVAAWFIDTGAGSDDNAGTALAPLKTVTELSWRLANTVLTAAVTATLIGNMAVTDKPYFTFQCSPIGGSFAFVGTPVDLFTSTITTYTASGAGPSTAQNTLNDAAVPGGSFTASGAMADGVLGSRVGVASFFWFAKDNGATTARVSVPSALLANGDTYKASQLPTVQQMRFSERRPLAVSLTNCLFASGTSWVDSCLFFQRCWFVSASMAALGFLNCAFSGATNTIGLNFGNFCNFIISTGGMYRHTGTGTLQVGGVAQGKINAGFTMQGAHLNLQSSFVEIAGDILFYDYTGPLGVLSATYWALILHSAGGIIGSGNTSYLYYAGFWSQIAYRLAPPAVAGSTTNPTPMHASGTPDAAIGGLPLNVNVNQNGVFLTA